MEGLDPSYRVEAEMNPLVNEALGALLHYVEDKAEWFAPDSWTWLPGTYEWGEQLEPALDGHSTSYTLQLAEDFSFSYSFRNREKKRKKVTEHELDLEGTWTPPPPAERPPAPHRVSTTPEEAAAAEEAAAEAAAAELEAEFDATADDESPEEGEGAAGRGGGGGGEEGEEGEGGAPEPPPRLGGLVVLHPARARFKRCISAGSRAAHLATKSPDGWVAVAAEDEAGFAVAAGPKELPSFELRFQVQLRGAAVGAGAPALCRAPDATGADAAWLAMSDAALAFVGASKKAAQRLGDPGAIVGARWLPAATALAKDDDNGGGGGAGEEQQQEQRARAPDPSVPGAGGMAQSAPVPFSAVAFVARYLREHSTTFLEAEKARVEAERLAAEAAAEAAAIAEAEAVRAAEEEAEREAEGRARAENWLQQKLEEDGDLSKVTAAAFAALALEEFGVVIDEAEAAARIAELEAEAEAERKAEMENAGGGGDMF